MAGRNVRVVFFSVAVAVGFLILPALSPGVVSATPLSDEAQGCLACHSSPGTDMTFGDRTTRSARVDEKRFAGSVHSAQGCTGCHGSVDPNSHPTPARYASRKEFQVQLAAACRTCHDDAQLNANQLHQRAITRSGGPLCADCHGSHAITRAAARKAKATASQYCLTCHSKPLSRTVNGQTISLTIGEQWIGASVHTNHECSDCHLSYSKTNHPAPKAITNIRDIGRAAAGTCERCHFEKAVLYRDSIHAILARTGNVSAPGCTDCHGAHQVGRGALADTLAGVPCRNCHGAIYEAFRTSVHGMSKHAESGPAPLCAGCHSAHDVKPAMASRSPRDMCLGCHSGFEADHRQWLPNPQAHLTMVACTACHVPLTYKRSIYLRFTDATTGKLLPDSDARKLLEARGGPGLEIGSRSLWELYQDLNRSGKVNVGVAVSMNDRVNAHYLAPKRYAVKQCEICHTADSSFFAVAALALAGPDGREVLHGVDPAILGSVYGTLMLKQFYVMSGTRMTAMDYAGALMVLGGIAVPVIHGSLRFMTRRRREKRETGKGGKP